MRLYGAALVLLNWVVKMTIVAILGVLALVLLAAWRPDLVDLLFSWLSADLGVRSAVACPNAPAVRCASVALRHVAGHAGGVDGAVPVRVLLQVLLVVVLGVEEVLERLDLRCDPTEARAAELRLEVRLYPLTLAACSGEVV